MADITTISQTAQDALVRSICDKFDNFSEARAAQLEDIQAIREAIYSTGSKNRTHTEFNIPDIWELAQTLKSHLMENLCTNPESMFDVSGATFDAQKSANRQKAMLVSYFERMNLQDELEKIVDSIVETGEATLLVSWETKTRRIRRVNSVLTSIDTGFTINNPAENNSKIENIPKKSGYVCGSEKSNYPIDLAQLANLSIDGRLSPGDLAQLANTAIDSLPSLGGLAQVGNKSAQKNAGLYGDKNSPSDLAQVGNIKNDIKNSPTGLAQLGNTTAQNPYDNVVSGEFENGLKRAAAAQNQTSNVIFLSRGANGDKLSDAQSEKYFTSKLDVKRHILDKNSKTGHFMSGFDKKDKNMTFDVGFTENFVTEEKVVFDGPKVKFIPAQDFVFDPERVNSFDSAPKIYRSYATVSEIRSNALNSLLDERKLAELSNMTNRTSNVIFLNTEKSLNDLYAPRGVKGVKGDQIELLEYWGDICIDGEFYENMLVVIAGRKEIIRLEQNPFVSQPFVHASIITDPRTSRGVSPLKIALGMSEVASSILNKQLDALSLIINPPYLAPKGCFKGEQRVSPGKIIEYDAALMPNQPIPLNFSAALQGWDFINFFKSAIESATGIYKTMAGNLSASGRTATEINYSASGQSARLNMFIDAISRKIIIPMVEKTAQTLANFKLGDEEIAIKTGGNVRFITVSDDVRANDYIYRYGDRRATLERKYRFKELFDIVSQFAQNGEFVKNINMIECFKLALEQYGIENPTKFLSFEDENDAPEDGQIADIA